MKIIFILLFILLLENVYAIEPRLPLGLDGALETFEEANARIKAIKEGSATLALYKAMRPDNRENNDQHQQNSDQEEIDRASRCERNFD